MNSNDSSANFLEGTALSPTFYEGPDVITGDLRQRRRYFTYRDGASVAAGYAVSLMFTIDRPAKDIWPYFKDFNRWQNVHQHYYSGVVGDLQGQLVRFSDTPNEPGPSQYKVLRVIPEHLIVIEQRGPWEGGSEPYDGYSVFMLNEHAGKTMLTIMLQHSIRTEDAFNESALT